MSRTLVTQEDAGTRASRYHQGSHRHLLHQVWTTPARPARVDAIIVPTARPPAYIRTAVAMAAEVGCTLVALCSRHASPAHTAALAAADGVELITIDVDELPAGLLPRFRTSRLLAGTRFSRRTDTSLKRNLGLLLARALGWERVVLLDDDVKVPRTGELGNAVRLLDRYATVGLSISGFPDNSVVCHAYRYCGGPQETFIGGGALAVGAASFTSFSPDVYNEDWFFLLDNDGLRPAAITGSAVQWPYDPFLDIRRARSQEFGDCLAEGVFSVLDADRRLPGTSHAYWRSFLANRREFIKEIIDRVEGLDRDPLEKAQILIALKAAYGRNLLITPELCVDYLDAMRLDRQTWRRHVQQAPTGLRPEKALAELGLLRDSAYRPVSSRRGS